MNEKRFMKYFLCSVVSLMVVYLVLGLGTYFWPKTTGYIVASGYVAQPMTGYHPAKGVSVFNGGFQSFDVLRYSFKAGGINYRSKFIGFYFPMGLSLPEAGEGVDVYYLNGMPGLSVIRRGVDWRVLLLTTCFLISVMYLRVVFLKMFQKM